MKTPTLNPVPTPQLDKVIGNNKVFLLPPGVKRVYGYSEDETTRIMAMEINKDDFEFIFATELEAQKQEIITTTIERIEGIIGDETELHSHPIIDEPIKLRNKLRAEQRKALSTLKQELLGKDK